MRTHKYKSQFGWENDNGLGEKLIQQIMRGEKIATVGPKALYSTAELNEIYRSVGKPSTVIDKAQNPRCNIRILEVFETKFGSPDPKVMVGEGYGSNAEAFKEAHREAWHDLMESGKLNLTDETVLIAELFELLPE